MDSSDDKQPAQSPMQDPITVKPAWYWINDAKGNGSVSTTMVFVSFWVTTFAYILSVIGKVGPVTIKSFDVSACSSYFIPILTLYFGRRFTEAKYAPKDKPSGT